MTVKKVKDDFPFVPRGKRVFIAGRTGTGKSWLARWLIERSEGPWIIINPKKTDAFERYNAKKHFQIDMKKIIKDLEEGYNVNLIPDPVDSTFEILDGVVLDLVNNLSNFGVVVDEGYTIHNGNGRAGVGMTSLLTRGRELKQSSVLCTQRPTFISQFCMSEADYFATLPLNKADDRKKIVDCSGCNQILAPINGQHDWSWYDVTKNKFKIYKPIPLDNL